MQAMILAAGHGKRLLPLTERRPKCLMPVANRPLLGLWFGRLVSLEVDKVVINTHHLADQVKRWLVKLRPAMMEVLTSHEPELLGTGGGLVKARTLLGETPFLLVNADVLCTADLFPLMRSLENTGAVAVLGLVDDKRFNTVAVSPQGKVLGFKGDQGIPADALWRTYSGLAAISPRLLDFLPPSGYSSLVEGLRAAIQAGELVAGASLDGFWDDLGTPQRLLEVHRLLAFTPPPNLRHLRFREPVLVANEAHVHPEAKVEGFVALDRGARIEAGARVKDSVLFAGARVAEGAVVQDAILGDDFVAQGEITGGAHA